MEARQPSLVAGRSRRARSTIATVTALVALAATPSAWACGGCFSPQLGGGPQTVQQSQERVLFAHDPATNTTTVWVEVRYSGAAASFGWILPLPKVPKVSVGTSLLFDRLDAQLRRRFVRTQRAAENCRDPRIGCGPKPASAGMDAFTHADASSGDDTSPGPWQPQPPKEVEVLEESTTGPYDYLVLKATDAQPLYDWLQQKGYQSPPAAVPIFADHIAKGDVFVAVKLSNGNGIDRIRPIALAMQDADPCVPLRLTSIAAKDDMEIAVTLAGPGRAVPKNHLHVVPNLLRMNLGSVGPAPRPNNYDGVVAAAIDAAGGHAFVTESAGKLDAAAVLPKSLLDVKELAGLTTMLKLLRFIHEHSSAEWRHPDVIAALYVHGKMSAGLAPWMPTSPEAALSIVRWCGDQWANFGWAPSGVQKSCKLEGASASLDLDELAARPVDGAALAAGFEAEIVTPMQTLVDTMAAASRTTRLVMRISPSEMDRDPIFGFAPELPDVEAALTFEVGQVCPNGWLPASHVRLGVAGLPGWLIQGTSIWNNASDPRFKTAPVAAQIEVLEESGKVIPVAAADVDLVDTAIASAIPGAVSLPQTLVLQPVTTWEPPDSDPIATTVGPWPRPYDCWPKPGWVDGQVPPDGSALPPVADLDGAAWPDGAPDGTSDGTSAGTSGGTSGSGGGCSASPSRAADDGPALAAVLGLIALLGGWIAARRRSGRGALRP